MLRKQICTVGCLQVQRHLVSLLWKNFCPCPHCALGSEQRKCATCLRVRESEVGGGPHSLGICLRGPDNSDSWKRPSLGGLCFPAQSPAQETPLPWKDTQLKSLCKLNIKHLYGYKAFGAPETLGLFLLNIFLLPLKPEVLVDVVTFNLIYFLNSPVSYRGFAYPTAWRF